MVAKCTRRASGKGPDHRRARLLRTYRDRYAPDDLTGPIPTPELPAAEAAELLVAYEEALARAERRVADLDALLARARIAAETSKGHERARATARTLEVAREGKRGVRRVPREVADLYVALMSGTKRRLILVSMWAESAGDESTREMINAPLSAHEALSVVARRCGFPSAEAARKFLEAHRTSLLKAGMRHFRLPRRR